MLSWITKFLLLLNPSLVGSQSTTVCTDRWLVLKRPTIADFFAYRHGSIHQLCRRKIFRRGELGKSWRWRFLRLTIPCFTRRYSPSCIHQACLLWVVSASFPYACSNITRCAFASIRWWSSSWRGSTQMKASLCWCTGGHLAGCLFWPCLWLRPEAASILKVVPSARLRVFFGAFFAGWALFDRRVGRTSLRLRFTSGLCGRSVSKAHRQS